MATTMVLDTAKKSSTLPLQCGCWQVAFWGAMGVALILAKAFVPCTWRGVRLQSPPYDEWVSHCFAILCLLSYHLQ